MATPALTPAFEALALKLQETALMHGDVSSLLDKTIRTENPQGSYGWYLNHDGDGESGSVVYCCGGKTQQADYEIGSVNGKAPSCSIDFDGAVEVQPIVSYLPQAEDSDHYTAMESAMKESGLYLSLPVYERFISKKTRASMDKADFAGKGTSFPIKNQTDLDAALSSIGQSGPENYSHDVIHANILKIGKRKGLKLPDSLKDDDAKESLSRETVESNTLKGVRLVESAGFQGEIDFKESSALNPLVKIISPGRGSSGYYTKELLERDGPQIFKRGTLMYINHATAAEEAARPEGDWEKLAAVTTGNAYWDESGPAGAALYAPAAVFSKYAAEIAEKAPHTGVSIRASGHYAESKTGVPSPRVTLAESKLAPDGKPGLIGKLTHADSIDLVTKAGRDGKMLLESAVQGENEMDKAEIQALIKEAMAPLQAENTRLRESISRQSAPQAIAEALREIRLPGPVHVVEATRMRIIRTLAPVIPLNEKGEFDQKKLAEMVEAEALHEAQYLASLGFGGADITTIGKRMTEAELAAAHAEDGKKFDEHFKESMDNLSELFVTGQPLVDSKNARKAFRKGRAA